MAFSNNNKEKLDGSWIFDDETPLSELTLDSFLSIVENKPNVEVNEELASLGLDKSIIKRFSEMKIKSLSDLTNLDFYKLRYDIKLNEIEFCDVVQALDDRNLRLSDCPTSSHPTVYRYLRQRMTCKYCNRPLLRTRLDLKERTCLHCELRLQRLNNYENSDLLIEPIKPEYTTYTGNEKGFTIYFNVVSKYKKPVKMQLLLAAITRNGDKHLAKYNYTNYAFSNLHFFPNTPRTFGKVWITDAWNEKLLKPGDMVIVTIECEEDHKKFTFSFSYNSSENISNGVWSIYDFREETQSEEDGVTF